MDPRHTRPQPSRWDWRGHLKREYREADRWYRGELERLGIIRPEPEPPRRGVLAFDSRNWTP